MIDYDKQKNESVINFYSNRKAEDRAHQASSGKTTDSGDTVAPETEKSSEVAEKVEEKAETKDEQPKVELSDQERTLQPSARLWRTHQYLSPPKYTHMS